MSHSLIYRTEPTSKKMENRKVKNGHAQKYQQTVRGIHVVSPEEEKEGERSDKMFNNHFTANLSRNLPIKMKIGYDLTEQQP